MGATVAKSDEGPLPAGASEEPASAAALKKLQEEMEFIGYVASHDLLAPVRVMSYATETLKEKRSLIADPAALEALQKIDEELAHMHALLHGLLEYIRLETFTFQHVPLESRELFTAATEVLADTIHATGATITHDTLPPVIGHRGRLNRLFINLIENALKFHGTAPPCVHVSARRDGSMWEFCVQDNGIGIDEEFHEIIFRLFQRLQPAEACPGYGIGLALSQKIVATHGGRLWVESSPGQGSRFYFTLPSVTG